MFTYFNIAKVVVCGGLNIHTHTTPRKVGVCVCVNMYCPRKFCTS